MLEDNNDITAKYLNLISMAIENVISNDRDLQLIKLRLGLYDGKSYTLEQVGYNFGITRERVRQIEKRTFLRIKRKRQWSLKRNQVDNPCVLLISEISKVIFFDSESEDKNIAMLILKLTNLPSNRLLSIFVNICYDENIVQEKIKSVHDILKGIQLSIQLDLNYQNEQKRLFKKLIEKTLWPPISKKIINVSEISPRRNVVQYKEGNTGQFFSDKNQKYISYESLLEYNFCCSLEKMSFVTNYIHQPFSIPYSIDGEIKLYYPDFFIVLNNSKGIVVEIKPRNQMGLYINLMKWKSLRGFCEKEGYGYLIIDQYTSITHYLKYSVDSSKCLALLNAITNNSINWLEYQLLRDKYHIRWDELTAIVIQNNIRYNLSPFRLSLNSSRETNNNLYSDFMKDLPISKQNEIKINTSYETNSTMTKDSLSVKINKQEKSIGRFINSGQSWTTIEDEKLRKLYLCGEHKISEIALIHGRTVGAIRSRLKKIGLI